MPVNRLLSAALLSFVAACASAPAASTGEQVAAAPTRNADLITAEELNDPAIIAGDALQAVQRLRPRFLMTRGTVSGQRPTAGSVQVSIDGGPLLRTDALKTVRPASIAEIRYLNASDAAQRFGTSAASGAVILVKSK